MSHPSDVLLGKLEAARYDQNALYRWADVRLLIIRAFDEAAALSQAGEPPSDDDDPTDETLITDAILCRVFDGDTYDRLREEWRAFDKSGWFHWSRAFGAFLNGALQARAAAQAGEPGREPFIDDPDGGKARAWLAVHATMTEVAPDVLNAQRGKGKSGVQVVCDAIRALAASSGATREGDPTLHASAITYLGDAAPTPTKDSPHA